MSLPRTRRNSVPRGTRATTDQLKSVRPRRTSRNRNDVFRQGDRQVRAVEQFRQAGSRMIAAKRSGNRAHGSQQNTKKGTPACLRGEARVRKSPHNDARAESRRRCARRRVRQFIDAKFHHGEHREYRHRQRRPKPAKQPRQLEPTPVRTPCRRRGRRQRTQPREYSNKKDKQKGHHSLASGVAQAVVAVRHPLQASRIVCQTLALRG
jgi:hypothetical protein